ncbi:protein S100-B-like [Cynoglossus semilaevis]|nr:protein S100-B-like [Cynoglossus semilaevis]
MARLDKVIIDLVDTYMHHASQQGDKRKMTMTELKNILENEISNPDLKEVITPGSIEQATKVLDKDGDGEINFREFCRCVSLVAKDYYQSKKGKGGKKKGKD